jgi:hypothetical protein
MMLPVDTLMKLEALCAYAELPSRNATIIRAIDMAYDGLYDRLQGNS